MSGRESRKVPSENELCQWFPVSRMTARKVLQELPSSGILMRQKGLGSEDLVTATGYYFFMKK